VKEALAKIEGFDGGTQVTVGGESVPTFPVDTYVQEQMGALKTVLDAENSERFEGLEQAQTKTSEELKKHKEDTASQNAANLEAFYVIGSEVEALGEEVKDLDASVKHLDTDVQNLDTAVTNLDTQVTNVDTKVANLDTQVANLDTAVTSFGKVVTDNNNKVEKLEDEVEEAKNALGEADAENAKALADLRKEYEEKAAELSEADASIRGDLSEHTETLKELGEADEALREEIGKKADASATEEALAGKSAIKVGGEVVAEFDADTKIDKVEPHWNSNGVVAVKKDGTYFVYPVYGTKEAYTLAYREAGGVIRVGTAVGNDDAVPLAQMNEALTDKADAKTVDILAKKVENIEAGTAADAFIVDDTTAYVKTIPTDVAPYAELLAVGGMINKVDGYSDDNLNEKLGTFTLRQGEMTNDGFDTFAPFKYYFPRAEVGKKYRLTYDCSPSGGCFGLNWGNGAHLGSGDVFVLTEDEYEYEMICFPVTNGTDEWGIDIVVPTTFSNFTLVEVIGVPVETKVTALDIVGKNLYNGGFGGTDCATEENGVLTMTKSQNGHRWTHYWYPPFPMDEASITYNLTKNSITTEINAEVTYESGKKHYVNLVFSTSQLVQKVSKIPASTDGTKIKSLMLYISASDTAGASATLTDIMIMPTATPTDTTFSPYHKTTFAIPAAVQALDGYGWSVTGGLDNTTKCNSIEWDENGKPTFVKRVDRAVYNGTEVWTKDSYEDAVNFKINQPNYAKNGMCMSNRFPYGTPNRGGVPCMHETPLPIVFYPSNPPDTVEGWKAQLAEWAAEGNPLVTYYELAEPIVTDISAYFTEDNLIPVEGGGTITAVNEHGLAAPTTIVYQKRGV
jgi:hypothetical protein